MIRRSGVILVLLASTSCTGGPTSPAREATCIAYLQIDGIGYSILDGQALAEEPREVVAHVQRLVPCNDQPQPGDVFTPPVNGDSNFLPAGTSIYAVPGHDASERLAVRPLDVWIVLGPLP